MHYSILFSKHLIGQLLSHDRKNGYKLYLFKTEKMYILILKNRIEIHIFFILTRFIKKTCISLIKGYNCILLRSSAIVKFKIITPTIFAQILMANGLLKVILFLVIMVEVVERRWRLLLSKCRLVGSRFV